MACRFLNILDFFGVNEPGSRCTPVKIWLAAALTALLGGCSISFPMTPLFVPASKEDAFGETVTRPFAKLLDAGDWQKAKAALAAALDPKADGSAAHWDNPSSGNKGSFAPVGEAYLSDAKTCRVFLAKIDRQGGEQSMQGTACADKEGAWTIAEAKPAKI